MAEPVAVQTGLAIAVRREKALILSACDPRAATGRSSQ